MYSLYEITIKHIKLPKKKLMYEIHVNPGYGNTAPKTAGGKTFTMFYAVFGVPLMLLWLSNIGTLMANTFKFAYSHSLWPSARGKKSGSKLKSATNTHARNEYITTRRGSYSRPINPNERNTDKGMIANPVASAITGDSSEEITQGNRKLEPTVTTKYEVEFSELEESAQELLMECAMFNIKGKHADKQSLEMIEQFQKHCHKNRQGRKNDYEYDPIETNSPRKLSHMENNNGSEHDGQTDTKHLLIETSLQDITQSPKLTSELGAMKRSIISEGEQLNEFSTLNEAAPQEHLVLACSSRLNNAGDSSSGRVPVFLVLIFVVVYILGGGLIFSVWEGWDFLTSAYFCFITLSTIGLGDYVPGRSLKSAGSEEGQAQLIACCLYLVLGLAIIAMSFNLVQEEVAIKVKNFAKHIGVLEMSNSNSVAGDGR